MNEEKELPDDIIKRMNEYLLNNTPCLSLSEIEEYFLSADNYRAVKDIVRRKLNL